jgi:hypothetical protein
MVVRGGERDSVSSQEDVVTPAPLRHRSKEGKREPIRVVRQVQREDIFSARQEMLDVASMPTFLHPSCSNNDMNRATRLNTERDFVVLSHKSKATRCLRQLGKSHQGKERCRCRVCWIPSPTCAVQPLPAVPHHHPEEMVWPITSTAMFHPRASTPYSGLQTFQSSMRLTSFKSARNISNTSCSAQSRKTARYAIWCEYRQAPSNYKHAKYKHTHKYNLHHRYRRRGDQTNELRMAAMRRDQSELQSISKLAQQISYCMCYKKPYVNHNYKLGIVFETNGRDCQKINFVKLRGDFVPRYSLVKLVRSF